MTKAHYTQYELAAPQSQHRGLKLFDLSHNKRRVHFQHSRIPVLSSKLQHEDVNVENKPKEAIIEYRRLDREGSRIPVYKSEKRPRKVSFEDDEMPLDRLKNADGKRTLKLRGLELCSLPKALFQQTNIESLMLSPERRSCLDYKLPFLPKEIGNLRNLRTLVVDTNELSEIPDEVSNLIYLEALALSNNSLTELPENFSKLEKLASLHLANNRFTEIPQCVCHLNSLGFLDMSDNAIVHVPPEICNLSGSLHTMLLFMNEIDRLPNEVSRLTSVTCLWLGENKLTELPEDFGELFRLDWGVNPCSSNIDHNPLVNPPLIICRQGPAAIREYFFNQRENTKKNVLRPAVAKKKQTLVSGW